MSSSRAATTVEQALRHAAARATLAPSVHNTQPWRFVVRPYRLDVYGDQRRRVPVIDPTGRQLLISCGAAVFGARAALAAAQFDAVTTLLPDPADADLLASITVVGRTPSPDEAACRLDAAAGRRHSNRRQFAEHVIPDAVTDDLTHAAAVEGAWLHTIHNLDDLVTLATLSQRADTHQKADPAYLAELMAWTTDDPARRDGVPSSSIPDTSGQAHDDIPVRDFDTHGNGELPTETRSSIDQKLVVLGTAGDRRKDWLVAGQALGRILLELTSAGYVASILSQVVENPTTRELLRRELRLSGNPQLLLRIGTAEPTPATLRLQLTDVISIDPSPVSA